MMINSKNMVSITEANQNFSRVARMVDESGIAIIMKNNRPCYLLLDFSDAESSLERASDSLSRDELHALTMRLITENREALEVLAK